MTGEFLYDTEARKGRWRDEAAEAAGLYTACHFTGEGPHGLEVAYATAEQLPNRTTVRDVWKQRHGRAAAPLMVVVGCPRTKPARALVCGPAGENPPVLDLDHGHAERLADAALREPNHDLSPRRESTASTSRSASAWPSSDAPPSSPRPRP